MNKKLERKINEYFNGTYACKLADILRNEADSIDGGSLDRDQHLVLEKALRESARNMVEHIGLEGCDGINKEIIFEELGRFENNDINPLIYLYYNKTPMHLEIETTDNVRDTVTVSSVYESDRIMVINSEGEICCCKKYKVISQHPDISFDLEGEFAFEFEDLEKNITVLINTKNYGPIRANIDLLFTGRSFLPLSPEQNDGIYRQLSELCSEFEAVIYKEKDESSKLLKGIYRPGRHSSLVPGSYIASNCSTRNIRVRYRSNADYPPESYIEILLTKGSSMSLDLCSGSELILEEDGIKLTPKGKVVR